MFMAKIEENLQVVSEEQFYSYQGSLRRVRITFQEELNPIYLLYEKEPQDDEISHFLRDSLFINVDSYTLTWG